MLLFVFVFFQSKLHEEPAIIMGSRDSDTARRLAHLESEVESKKAEVAILKEQVGGLT
jgi:hypothetical protein